MAHFDLVDFLVMFGVGPFWITLGLWLVGRAPRLNRYVYGVGGYCGLAVGLFVYHGLAAWLYLPVLTVGVGLGYLGLAHTLLERRDRRSLRAAQHDARVRAAAALHGAAEAPDADL